MICGADEIGLIETFPKKEEKEIVDLTTALSAKDGSVIGQSLAEALDLTDVIFEIDNKSLSNRPDLWGHYGLAREVATLLNHAVNPYVTEPIKAGAKDIKIKITRDNPELCAKYTAVAISGIAAESSP